MRGIFSWIYPSILSWEKPGIASLTTSVCVTGSKRVVKYRPCDRYLFIPFGRSGFISRILLVLYENERKYLQVMEFTKSEEKFSSKRIEKRERTTNICSSISFY